MLNGIKKTIEKICIIGGSGRIGNKLMSILIQKGIKGSLLLTKYTANELASKNGNDEQQSNYLQVLNNKIRDYNESKQENEQRCYIPANMPIYIDIERAYHEKNHVFVFCGKNSTEVRYFLNQLKVIRQKDKDSFGIPITFLSIADRLADDKGDLNLEFKNNDFTSIGIFYHHADMITEAGERIKSEIEKLLRLEYPIEKYQYELYDFGPSKAYGKAYNTTRKACRLLGCEATNHQLFLTKTAMNSHNSSIKINENLSVTTARYVDDSFDVLPEHQWLRSTKNPDLPSIGIRLFYKQDEVKRTTFFFKDLKVGLTEDMAIHTYDKVIKKREKDKTAILSLSLKI